MRSLSILLTKRKRMLKKIHKNLKNTAVSLSNFNSKTYTYDLVEFQFCKNIAINLIVGIYICKYIRKKLTIDVALGQY